MFVTGQDKIEHNNCCTVNRIGIIFYFSFCLICKGVRDYVLKIVLESLHSVVLCLVLYPVANGMEP